MENKKIINIIGRGNVATHLANAFEGKAEINMVNPHSLAELNTDADLTIISVTDTAIAKVLDKLPKINGIVAHTSGSTSIDVFKSFRQDRFGVFYKISADLLALKFRPEDTRRIQKFQFPVHAYPLFSLRDTGLVACLSACLAGKRINESGLTHIRNPHNDGSDGSVLDPAFSVPLNLLPAGFPNDPLDRFHPLPTSGINLQHMKTFLFKIFHPQPVCSCISQIGFI